MDVGSVCIINADKADFAGGVGCRLRPWSLKRDAEGEAVSYENSLSAGWL